MKVKHIPLLLLLAILWGLATGCSPSGKVARHYGRYQRYLNKEERKPQHGLPLQSLIK